MDEAKIGGPEVNPFETLVLGLGNILWADEGFGVRTVEALNAAYRFPDDVRLMDGGTQGIFLLPWVRAAKRLLILDAIDFGLEPGELRVMHQEDVPRFMGVKKVSMHQAGFQEVLMSAQLADEFPEKISLVGVQPELLDDYGGSLRPVVRDRIPEAVAAAIAVLRDWGVKAEERLEPMDPGERIAPDELKIDAYEQGRAP
ncbi:MAG: HyaD/HybD family hydrogenase maturation endopeptidase [Chromatiales bacterium]|jgi:hydrogenase maturation protease|nr:HyaD/HybD family hydrogenase maturation endopeptidase [Chromatiales bacterium]MDH4031923.1 HyaD/HybD family hydrogenase maturation endopeptidase [Chromatiales bacterium]